jgi:DDE superfamily endonuclease
MLQVPTLPGALSRVLDTFRPCFTAPTFQTFTMLVAGLFAQPVGRTVCGMLTGAGLTRIWHHGRAHRFFSTARWSARQLGLLLAELIVTHLLAADAPITVAIEDTLFRRRGKNVHAVGWFHDGSAAGEKKLGYSQQLGRCRDHRDAAVLLAAGGATGAGRVGRPGWCIETGPRT